MLKLSLQTKVLNGRVPKVRIGLDNLQRDSIPYVRWARQTREVRKGRRERQDRKWMLKARCRVGGADEASRGLKGLIERQINAGAKEADAVSIDSIASPDDDVVR
jgi:hypothetical protein